MGEDDSDVDSGEAKANSEILDSQGLKNLVLVYTSEGVGLREPPGTMPTLRPEDIQPQVQVEEVLRSDIDSEIV